MVLKIRVIFLADRASALCRYFAAVEIATLIAFKTIQGNSKSIFWPSVPCRVTY